ncbi:hypothetical protein V5O48_008177 [Marasmius crinis-equi]|uniref:Uncharacterized protein n=1 Tax=Marasmius crinis-equi TaxID=585013 RepID=A0ABR3FES6_9AGAR
MVRNETPRDIHYPADRRFNTNNKCHFTNPVYALFNHEAFNVACHGNCCVYAAGDNTFENPTGRFAPDRDRTSEEARRLLGCSDTGPNKINVMQSFSDGHAVSFGWEQLWRLFRRCW